MIPMIFIGIILAHLGMLKDWCLFWYILGLLCSINIEINTNQKGDDKDEK